MHHAPHNLKQAVITNDQEVPMHSIFTSFPSRSAPTQTSCRKTQLLTNSFAANVMSVASVASVMLGMSLAAGQAMAQGSGAASAAASSPSANPSASTDSSVFDLLVGTYTGSGKSEGIYVYRFDTASGAITRVASAQAVNPSYLVVSKDRQHVYTVNELPGDNGPASQRGGVSAFRFDQASGQLTFVNRVSSDGNDPAYLALSPDGRYLVAANYSVASNPGGSFAVFALEGE